MVPISNRLEPLREAMADTERAFEDNVNCVGYGPESHGVFLSWWSVDATVGHYSNGPVLFSQLHMGTAGPHAPEVIQSRCTRRIEKQSSVLPTHT